MKEFKSIKNKPTKDTFIYILNKYKFNRGKVARVLDIHPEFVRRYADEYGITLPEVQQKTNFTRDQILEALCGRQRVDAAKHLKCAVVTLTKYINKYELLHCTVDKVGGKYVVTRHQVTK